MNIQTIDKTQLMLKESTKSEHLKSVINISVSNLPILAKSNSELLTIDWTNPLNFGGKPIFLDEIILPEIDYELLPPWISNNIYTMSYQNQVSLGTATMLTVAALAASIQRQFIVSPYKNNSLMEPLNIWTLAVTDSRQKRVILDAVLKPIVNKEKQLIEELKLILDDDLIQDFHKATVRCLINKAARTEVEALTESRNWETNSKHRRAKDLVYEASKAKDKMPPPIKSSKMIITNDITVKNLQLKLAEHFGKLAIISDDSNLLKSMASPDFLHGYMGGELRVKINDRYVTELNHIAITTGLIVPPEALETLKPKKRVYNKELASNFLYYIDDAIVGKNNLCNKEVDPQLAQFAYEAGFELMLGLQLPFTFDENTEKYIPTVISLNDETLELCHHFCTEVEFESSSGGKFEALRGWIENLPCVALRIAGLVHIANLVQQFLDLIVSLPAEQRQELMNPCALSPLSPLSHENLPNNLVIKKEIMVSVIEFCKKLIVHAQAAYGLMTVDETTNDAQYLLDWLYKHFEVDNNGAAFIRQHKLNRDSHFRKSPIARIIKVFNQLCGQNVLSPLVKLPTRKPTYIRYVNPTIFKCKAKDKFQLIAQGSTLLPYAQAS